MKTILHPGRTANAALAASILASAIPAPYISGDTRHESISTANGVHLQAGDFNEELTNYLNLAMRTANASLFVQANFSEPLTQYATGWRDAADLEALCEFLAPTLPPSGERYEHITYPNAEAFLSDVVGDDDPRAIGDDDLRAIGGDFKTVDYTQAKTSRTIPNRGLRIVLDYDRVKHQPNWQEFYTGMLTQRIARNAFRRKYALAVAAATDAPLVWDAAGTADPDYDLANQAALSGDTSGVRPSHALWGLGAKLLRLQTYGATNAAKAVAGRAMTPEQASAMAGLRAMVDESRYQAGTSKSRIVGSKVLLFISAPSSTQDPSNFKTAKATTETGGLRAVYVRQLSVKLWEIVVECYETEFTASPFGVRTLSVTAS